VTRVEPELLIKRHHNTLLRLVNLLLGDQSHAQAGMTSSAQQQELRAEAQVDRSASDLTRVKKWCHDQATVEVLLAESFLEVLASKYAHGALHVSETTLSSIAFPIRS
jgi:hypothetical protein